MRSFLPTCLTVLLLLCSSVMALAQTVTGTVTSEEDGSALPGVSVSIKGTTSGTITDANGSYSVNAESGSVLVFSFIGYAAQEITVGSQSVIDVVLASDVTKLTEVVVTALGIEKETKSLGYSVTELEGKSLTQAREVNVANSLAGKVAGVNVSGVSGGPGSSSNVVIRGLNSLSGSSPLYVINGVPMDNSSRGSAGIWGGADFGDGISNINPDDIESMTVLKGATAAALYGSRAANGVIVITTKSGKSGQGMQVDFNSNVTLDKVIDNTDFQTEYGQGINGARPTDETTARLSGNDSWGEKLDGVSTPQFDGVSRPYSSAPDNISNFYKTGKTVTNTIALSGGNDKVNYRFSASDLMNMSVVPNSGLDRNTFNLNLNVKPNDKFDFGVVSNVILEDAKNRPSLSDSPGNSNFGVLFLPSSLDVKTLDPGINPDGSEMQYGANTFVTNPYFAANNFIKDLSRRRYINIIRAGYSFTDWLKLTARVGNDTYYDRSTQVTPTGAAYRPNGDLNEYSGRSSEFNADAMLTVVRDFTEDLSFTGSLGGNLRKMQFESITGSGTDFSIPNLYTLDNLVNKTSSYGKSELEVQSFFYSLEFGFKDMLYVNTTGRQDKFSVLDGKTIFYPSVGASFVFSELANLGPITFGKFRASWARSTGDPSQYAYQTRLTYGIDQSNLGYPIGIINGNSIPNNDLAPYNLDEFEIGLDMDFFNNRLGLDVAYFSRNTTDEIVNVTTSPTSGYSGATLNAASLKNTGIELLLTATPVKTNDFNWNVSFNYTKLNNEVTQLEEDLDNIQIAESRTRNAYIQHVKGLPASQIMAFDVARDANGDVMLDPNGVPMQGELTAYGSGFHDSFGGITNEFNYKGFNLSFLIDFKSGGKIFSATDYYAYQRGLHKNTLEGRETDVNGANAWDYYPTYANNVSSQFVYDAGFSKLRQVIFGYNLPSSLFENSFIKSVNISFVGRNLAILSKQTDNIDPESNFNNTVAQGLELAGVPATRSYGFNLNVKF